MTAQCRCAHKGPGGGAALSKFKRHHSVTFDVVGKNLYLGLCLYFVSFGISKAHGSPQIFDLLDVTADGCMKPALIVLLNKTLSNRLR